MINLLQPFVTTLGGVQLQGLQGFPLYGMQRTCAVATHVQSSTGRGLPSIEHVSTHKKPDAVQRGFSF
jgi:hypothetical protein